MLGQARHPPAQWREAVIALAEKQIFLASMRGCSTDPETDEQATACVSHQRPSSHAPGKDPNDLIAQPAAKPLSLPEPEYSEAVIYTAVLLTQGKHRFYTLANAK